MSFVQNFPFFSIILSLVCAVVSFAANARWARRLSIFLLSASVVLQAPSWSTAPFTTFATPI